GAPRAREALAQRGVVGQARRVVQQAAQQLIVDGGPDTELPPDGLLLCPGMAPPLPLEHEHAPLPLPPRPSIDPRRSRFWGDCGGRSPPHLCVILHVLIPAVLRRQGPGCVPGPADRTPKILCSA